MDSAPGTTDFSVLLEGGGAARLSGLEQLVRSLPQLFPAVLSGCDLVHRADGTVALPLRFTPGELRDAERRRLEFWCARARVRVTFPDDLGEADRASLAASLVAPLSRRADVAPDALASQAAEFFTQLGAPADRFLGTASPLLTLDVGGPGWAGARFDPERRTLFLPGPYAPAEGDVLTLSVRFPGEDRPLETLARVLEVRPGADGVAAGTARPEPMDGFTLELAPAAPAALLQALASNSASGPESRRHVRYPAPGITITELQERPPFPPGTPGAGTEPAGSQRAEVERPVAAPHEARAEVPGPAGEAFPEAIVEYADDTDLAADAVCENISLGGAFVRTTRPSPVGTTLSLTLRLPDHQEIATPAAVVVVKEGGMGVRFALGDEAHDRLAFALARISARPRRVLIVDDDAVVRRMLHDAFQQRGFEVLTALDGATGLSTVVDELLGLDLLVTDLRMPGMDGQAFVRTIREAGGESELAIVVVSAHLEPGLEKRLQREGADAVLDKELGPEIIARAADAVLERKRGAKG